MNKLIKTVTVVIGAGAMLNFAGCGASTPDGIAQEVVSCLKSADMDGISQYSTAEFTSSIGILKEMMDGSSKDEINKFKKELASKKYEVGQAVINGDKAKVPVKIDGKERPISLVKIDGKWKVDEFNFKE